MSEPHERLQEARARAGYSTATAAALAFGWPVSTYLGHENGSRGMRPDAARRYARAFGVNLAWLLDGRPEDDFADAVRALTPIPIVGVLEYGAYRKTGTRLWGAPEGLNAVLPGYEQDILHAFQVYGADGHHFVFSVPIDRDEVQPGDEVILRRVDGELVELTAWKVSRAVNGMRLIFSPAVSVDRHSADILDEGEIVGLIVGELRIKPRRARPSSWED